MLVCLDCGESFHEEDCGSHFERVGERYTDGWYESTCPHCNSSEISEAQQCERCEAWVEETYDGFCDHCKKEIFERFDDATADFTELERRYIYDAVDFESWIERGRD